MPLTQKGKAVLKAMKSEYGDKKGKDIFYASINKGKPGSEKWHKYNKKKLQKARSSALK